MSGNLNGSYLRLSADPDAPVTIAREDVGYFFINSFLLSRIDSDLPSDLAEYDEDVNIKSTALLSYVEPAILICVATFVAYILVSLYLPIFSLGSQIKS